MALQRYGTDCSVRAAAIQSRHSLALSPPHFRQRTDIERVRKRAILSRKYANGYTAAQSRGLKIQRFFIRHAHAPHGRKMGPPGFEPGTKGL
jgi:hypothetical protein